MASIFKRSKRKNTPYSIQYTDHFGKRKTVKGFTDRGLTEQLAAKLEGEARLRISGLIDPEQERLAEKKLSPIGEHLTAFEQSLTDNSPKYVRLTMTRTRRIVEGCGFQNLGDIESELVRTFMRSLRKSNDLGHKTYNHYLQAMASFCYWCVATKRLLINPMVGLERLNTAVDVRHKRRALEPAELSKLLHSAQNSGIRIQSMTGEQRARLYLLSYMTGLRKAEIASLTARSFNLEASPPTLTVEAACSKHRRKDVLPMHPDLVVRLREWLVNLVSGEKLFPKLAGRKTWLMVRQDLERVGIPYENENGIADFHAAGRHSHITELMRNGATLPEAKELARHSDIRMTMRYTHIGIGDQARALANLPTLRTNPEHVAKSEAKENVALHGRCISSGAEGYSVSAVGSDKPGQERQNPRGDKGFDADRRQLVGPGKVEAAGIEPASRDISMTASTCVVGSFPLSPRDPQPTGFRRGKPGT